MQSRSETTYASMSSKNTSNNLDVITTHSKEIFAIQQSHHDAIIQLNSKFDEIMKLLEKSKKKGLIEDDITSHQFEHSSHKPCDEQGNFLIGNQRWDKIFEQDDDATKRVCLEVVELYGK